MKAYALIVGIQSYNVKSLDNAVNDAEGMAQKMLSLGYIVDLQTDAKIEDIDRSLVKMQKEAEGCDVVLFYFSGHGMQIEGYNYITAVNTNFSDEISVKHHGGIKVDEVLDRMKKTGANTKILILDACRDSPLKGRGFSDGMAPMYAPKGTLIAFSTSPGETASDGGDGQHSIYTGTLLRHIDEKNITVEECFKRVRTTVYALTGGKQLSWEHTSLIGDFYFNEGQMCQSTDLPYRVDVVKDGKWVSGGTPAEQLIEDLKNYNWSTQNGALKKLECMSQEDMDRDIQFLFGRNLLQVACGGEFYAQGIFNRLGKWLKNWIDNGVCHVLNGILFEMYFGPGGNFRTEGFKKKMMDEICRLETNKLYEKSFDFIEAILMPFKSFLFYIPSAHPKSLSVDITFEERTVFEKKNIALTSLQINGKELLAEYSDNQLAWESYYYDEMKEQLKKVLTCPSYRLVINSKLSDKDMRKRILVPSARIIK